MDQIHDAALSRVIALLAAETDTIAVASGDQPAASSTQLTSETARKTADYTNINGNTYTARATFDGSQANGAIRSAGLFGTSLIASTSSLENKTASQSLTVQFVIEAVADSG